MPHREPGEDGRDVRPTARAGTTVAEASRAISEVEAAWAGELGGQRLEQLRSALRDLREGRTG